MKKPKFKNKPAIVHAAVAAAVEPLAPDSPYHDPTTEQLAMLAVHLAKDIPTNPQRTYADKGWKGMGDWLGTG